MTEFCFDCIFYGECGFRRHPPADQNCMVLFRSNADDDTNGQFEGELEGSGDESIAENL